MATHIYEASHKLGDDNVDHILNYTRGGKMTSQTITDFAQLLGRPPDPYAPNRIYGSHTQRMETNNTMPRDAQMRAILSDWWAEELFDDAISSNEAVDKLVRTLSRIGCKPLVNKLVGPRQV
jgi:hypothetical protein